MARKPKPSGREFGKPLGERQVKSRRLRPKFLIVCEGTQTEPNYFKGFRVNKTIEIVVRGEGADPLSLVERTCELRQKDEYTNVWCVFDRDSFPPDQFNEAIRHAHDKDIHVAYSNEAFELWYLLHFAYHNAGIGRELYKQKLTACLGEPYRKNDLEMYRRLESWQPEAIRNAERLLAEYGDAHNPEKDNPCTMVHLLVQELNTHRH